MNNYLCKTPVRIAFAGGGTDVEPYASDYGGFVINSTINIYFRCVFSKREDNLINIYSNDKFFPYKFDTIEVKNINYHPSDFFEAIFSLMTPKIGMDLYVHGEPPKKAGLGASASLCTCLISGILKLEEREIDLSDIAEKAYKIEQNILNNIGGRQDQYAAVHGGFNEIQFLGDSDVRVSKLPLTPSFKKEIENNLILFYTGEPHTSGNIVKEQVNFYVKNKEKAKIYLDNLKNIAYEIKDSLNSENLEKFGALLTKDLENKSDFNPLLTTTYMKDLHKMVIKNGGIGGRVCGAGGGGCMLWLTNPKTKETIGELLSNQQGKLIKFNFVDKGLDILEI
ncbi:MAG: hypothetical protein ACFFAO_08410 [Candidatus Hermodarchaeota archaeon]